MTQRRFGQWIWLALSLLLFAVVPARMLAQIDTGGVTGTVTDSTGAVVPGVKITLTNSATQVAMTTTSTRTGSYTFTAVRPGTYSLTGVAPGFSTFQTSGLEVHIQDIVTLDMSLSAGNVSQHVEVTAAAPLLQAENGEVGQTIVGEEVNDLPLQTRDWASLSQLSAGVTTAPAGNPSADSGSGTSAYFVSNGANVWQNDFRLNGINDNIEMYGGSSALSNATITPPPDALAEFKLQTANYSAEFGHSTGAVVNATTKSGTNHFHGDIWEYVRNDIFNANPLVNKLANKARPEYRQNIFGGTIGGPIVKDKTFFFFSYQGQRYVLPSPVTSTVPSTSMISSNFTNLQDLFTNGGINTDVEGRTFPHGTILDPATTRAVTAGVLDPYTNLTPTASGYVRDPFYTGGSIVGMTNYATPIAEQNLNILPAGRLDPNAIKLLGVYPAPNEATASQPLNNNYFYDPKQYRNIETYDVRIDHHFNANNYINGTYDRTTFNWQVPANLPGLAVGETGGRVDSFPAYAFAVSYTHVFTPTLTNEMHVGMMHADKLQQSIYGNQFGIPASFGIQGIQQVANNGGLPPITINGLTHIGVGNYTPTLQYVYSIEGADSVTKLYRNHVFKMGVQVDDIEGNISQPPAGRGNFTYSGQYTDIPNKSASLNGLGDLLLIPQASTVGGPNNVGGLTQFYGSNVSGTDDNRYYIGAYFQDDWKITPALTLNLGLRWDYFTPYAETRGRQANFVPVGGNGATGTYYMSNEGCSDPRSAAFNALLVASNITLKCVSSKTLGVAQKLNFSPRLGFAYRTNAHMVVRGGYGIAYGALGNLGYGGTLGTNYPFVYTTTFNAPNSYQPLALPSGATATMENAFSEVNVSDPTVNTGAGLNLYGRQYNYQTPYIQSVNLSVQDQFTKVDSIQIGYIGSVGRHLDNLGYNNSPTEILAPSANPQSYVPYPNFARNATYETTNAVSGYNSMQITYQRQMSTGLTMLANYTFSKCLSDQHTQAEQNQQYRAEWLPGFGIGRDYGLCDSDAPNVVHISGTYKLPFGRGETFANHTNAVVDAFIGGWTLNGIYTYQSGQPFTVTCPQATSEYGCFAFKAPGVNEYAGGKNLQHWLNPAAFVQPPQAITGQASFAPLGGGPQQARGPHYTNLDMSLFKNFELPRTLRLQVRAEAFNLSNTSPLGQPTGNLNFTTTTFTQITSERNSTDSNRRLQFAAKLFF
jgi:hypothetical protein